MRPVAVKVSMAWSSTTRSTPRSCSWADRSIRWANDRPSRSSFVITIWSPAGPTTAACTPTLGKDHRTDVRVTDVSRPSRVDIEQPRYPGPQPHAEGRADPGKEYLFNATLGKRCAYMETRRSASPQTSRKDAINNNFANRTPVRAKTRVSTIENHSMQSMKKASYAGLS